MPTITNEIWIAMATLAYETNNIKYSASTEELKNEVRQFFNDERPGVATHISQHVVAQKRLSTGYNKCFLTEVGRGFRRLYLPGDVIHESRTSNFQKLPLRNDIPENFQYLFDWYLAETGNLVNQSPVQEPISRRGNHPEYSNAVKDLTETFQVYLGYFNDNIKFSGPSTYFHKKTIEKVRTAQDYSDLLSDNYFLELVYATLVSWGMHTMGKNGPKMANFEGFKTGIAFVKDQILELQQYKLYMMTDDEFNQINSLLKSVFENLKIMTSSSQLVGNSKVMHHLLPDIIPPIDRSHTLKFFYGHMYITRDESEVFLECMANFHKIACSVPDISIIPLGGFNTSIPKMIDNAIMGYVMRNKIEVV